MRYYLDVPQTTFDMLNPESESFNQELKDKLSRFQWIEAFEFERVSRKSDTQGRAIVEVQFDGNQYYDDWSADPSNEGTEFDALDMEVAKLQQYVDAGIILGFGRYVAAGEPYSIYDYLQQNPTEEEDEE